jgi:hypothetical protein
VFYRWRIHLSGFRFQVSGFRFQEPILTDT